MIIPRNRPTRPSRPKRNSALTGKRKLSLRSKAVTLGQQQLQGWGQYMTPPEQRKAKELGEATRKRTIKKIRKKALGYVTDVAISSRHEADLLDPGRPFAADISGQARITIGHGLLSTAIVSFEYYPDYQMLILVWWKDWKKGIIGSAYAYFDVPINIYEGLVKASSKGRYVYYNIRTSFKYKRLN